MTINLTDPANHPANGPLTVERIARLIAELRRSLGYQNGGDMAYVIADAIKGLEELLVSRESVPVYQVMYGESWRDITEEQYHDHTIHESPIRIVYTAPPAPAVPEALPCPVLLEPGLRFGKGIKTQLLFGALKRRAEYYAELDAMTPEQRTDREVGLNNLRNALGIVPLENHEMALLLSKEVIPQSFGNTEQLDTENGRDELPYDPQIAEYEKIMQQAIPDCWCRTCRPVTMTDMRFVVCPNCGNKRCPHANDHRNACTGSNEPGQEGSAYPAAPQEVK